MRLSNLCLGVLACIAIAAYAAEPQPALGPLNMDTPALLPAQIRALRNPIPADAKSIEQGRKLFEHHGCNSCHDARSASSEARRESAGEIFARIRDGVGSMPPAKNTVAEEEEVWHLVNFLMSLRPEDQSATN